MNFKQSFISSDGQIAYLAFMQNGINLINIYNLTTPSITLIGTFDNNGVTVSIDKFCITDQYLITFSPYNMNIYYYSLSNKSLIGTFTLG